MKDASQKSHVGAWIAAAVAVPFLYVLSAPPVCIAMHRNKPPPLDPFVRAAHAESAYYKPYSWLHDNTPLSAALYQYEEMWLKML